MSKLRWPGIATGLVVALLAWNGYHGLSGTRHTVASQGVVRADEQPPVESLARADELSGAFRYVARKVLPAVVSVESIGKTSRREMVQFGDPFGGDSPFGENSPFGNDPLLREFFGRNRGRFQQTPPEGNRGSQRQTIGNGSGFIIDASGIIMTNAHVVRGAEEVRVQLSDGRKFTATDIKSDDRADVAVMRIKVDEQLPFVSLGDDEQMEIGDWVMAFGSPFGLHRTVTQGIISAKARSLGTAEGALRPEFLQTDAAINPGNSGGPLVNMHGEVIGINTAISTSSGGYDGVGFAVPVSLAKWVGDQLTQNGKVRRAFIGVKPQDIDADMAEALNLTTPQGVLIAEITKDSPSDKAGLQIQDVIISLNGQDISSSGKLVAVAEKLVIGQKYPIKVLRQGKEMSFTLTVAEFPELVAANEQDQLPETAGDGSEASITELGLTVAPVTQELAEQLNADAGVGVVVKSVDGRGFASRLQIQPGHIILKIGDTPVNSVADVRKAVEQARQRKIILLYIKTDSGSSFISVPFAARE